MSTIEDFKNAPIGATASHDNGSRVMKIDDGKQRWITRGGIYLSDEQMACFYYTLDPIEPAPTTAREALDLAWELAHEVKPGQVIPKGTRYLDDQGSGLKENRARCDINISPGLAPAIRTLEPLPDPEPSWIDAPAVIATCDYYGMKTLHVPLERERGWKCTKCRLTPTSHELRNVTPLYPKGQDA